MGRKRTWTDEQLVEAVGVCVSKRQVLDALGLRPTGGNHTGLDGHLVRLGLCTDHFTGQGWNAGEDYVNPRKIPMSDILVEDSSYKNSNNLRRRLLSEKVFPHQCDVCGLTEWLGKPIPLELDHINGVHSDNRIENLRLLDPTCHALTRTYKGKNMETKSFKAKNTANTSKGKSKPTQPQKVRHTFKIS